ncbi:hypothetical protein F5Y19DRAFT_51834 [Xylariaceae sp. FL1651]|nr:hypothetical protein F5Y19DRAFT_51834 [Xylariaceae sp. FL1651]
MVAVNNILVAMYSGLKVTVAFNLTNNPWPTLRRYQVPGRVGEGGWRVSIAHTAIARAIARATVKSLSHRSLIALWLICFTSWVGSKLATGKLTIPLVLLDLLFYFPCCALRFSLRTNQFGTSVYMKRKNTPTKSHFKPFLMHITECTEHPIGDPRVL